MVRDVSALPEGEVVDHVQAGHCLPQHEERDLRQLPPQSKQAAGKVLVHATVFSLFIRFFPFSTENGVMFFNLTLF